ncbi:MAG: hypothetical protein NVS3B3_22100 [Aquirhabdus sp.]
MDLAERMKIVISQEIRPEKRYKELTDMTRIGAGSWRQFFDGKQRPTAAMIEAICQKWPQYAFWIATGIDDCESGHIAAVPTLHDKAQIESSEDTEFFKTYLRLSSACSGTGKVEEAIANMGKALLIMNYSFSNPKFEKIANKKVKNIQFSGAEYQSLSQEREKLVFSDLLLARKKTKKSDQKQTTTQKTGNDDQIETKS